MNVVLLAINAKYMHSSLSVWTIAAGMCEYGKTKHAVNVVETTINQKIDDIVNSVTIYDPDVIGISTYIWNAGVLPSILEQLRERNPNTLIVLGGPEASHNPDYWLNLGADYVLPDEGEYGFPMFLDEVGDGKAVNKIYRRKHLQDEKPVDPFTETYFQALGNKISYIEASRGCPFKCAFCLSAGESVKNFPIDTIKTQIEKLAQSDTHIVKFVDRTFNCNAERAFDLLEYIISMDTTCRFHFEVAADLFDERTISLLATAPPGRIQLEIGLQSFYQPALDASSRKTDINKAEKNVKALLKAQNIHIHVDLIAGLPYEALVNFKESFSRAFSLKAHTLQLGFLKLLHGSVLRERAEELGIQYNKQPPYEVLNTKWLSAEDLDVLRRTENALQRTYNKGRFLLTIEYVLTASKLDAFTFFNMLGDAFPNHGTQLEQYVRQVYEFCTELQGVEKKILTDCMICDWLSMVKGKNAPSFMKNTDSRRELVKAEAEVQLKRKVGRHEYAVLSSGKGVFVDSHDRDVVTELYKIHHIQ
ncbi:MAG: B12-binding domain-containing radical SAM protein [Oscillospiraceae bacterium]|nr:B12-binding domain-containing radical SAM protein [Oscillospiraceae bacterium]